MKKSSAFTRNICHKDQILNFEPPIIHFAAYVTGGLTKLYSQIHAQKASAFPQYEYGQFTDQSGQFITKKDCLLVSRYRVVEVIGTGSRGQSAVIVRAKDEFDGNKLVVVKVLHTNWRWLGAQEAHCLWKLQVADPYRASSTSRLLNIFMHDDHYCMVFEALCPEPLTSVFTDIPRDQILPCIRKVTLRLLSTLGFLKQQNVIHADLKPENILLKKEGNLNTVTVIDFGNAMQHVFPEVSLYYKDFIVQTPLYRAPEVMFGIPFGTEIDMWSLGCILAELYKGTQLFHGTSKIPLIKEMSKLLGPFPLKVYQRGKFYSSLKQYTADIVQKDASVILEKKLGSHDYLFRDFLAGLLRYDPSERMTPYQAAQHPFLCSDLPLAFLLPSSKDLKPFSEYPFQPVKTYISANPCTENNEGSPAITEDEKVMEDDKVIKKDDKITCREQNRKTSEGKRSKGNVKTEFPTNWMEDDENVMKERNNLDFRRPLLSETFTVDTLKGQKEHGKQSNSESNRTAKCPSRIRRTGPNYFRINIPTSKDIKGDQIQVQDNDRPKVLPEHNHDRGLKRKYLDSYDTADYCPKQSLQDKITKIGNASNSKRTDSFESVGNKEENNCTKFPDRFKPKSAERMEASKVEVSHHDGNCQFQFGSKPDLQSIMEAISREQEIVEKDMKRKSEEAILCRNVGTESMCDRQKKDNSHCSQGRNKETRTILPKDRAKCNLKCSGTAGGTENDSEDEIRTESSPICRSGITVSKRAGGREIREDNTQKTKLSMGLQSAIDEEYDEVDAVQNPVFLTNRRRGGESRDHKFKKRSQNQDDTLGNQCSDYKNKDTSQIQDVPVGHHSQDYCFGKNSHSQGGTSSSQCMPGGRCHKRRGSGCIDSRSQGEEQVKYSTKTVREKKVISTGGEDVPRSQTTTRYKKEVKKRLMFSGALKSKRSHSVRTKKKSHKIKESRSYAQNKDEKKRTSELRCSSGSRKIRQQRGGRKNESDVGDPYQFTEDSPFKQHQHSNGVCRNVDSVNNEHSIKSFANCTRLPKISTQPSSGLSKSFSEDILLSYHQMHSSNEPGSIGQKSQIDSDRETDYMCRNTLSVDPRITKDKRNNNSSNCTSNWQVKRTSEEKRPCVKEQSRKGVFTSAYDLPQTDMEKKKKVCSHEKRMVRSPLSSGVLERNGKVSDEKYQVSHGPRKQESKGNKQTSCTYGSQSVADNGSQCTGHWRNDRGGRIHKLQKGLTFCHEGDIDEDCDISMIASPPSDCGVETYCKHNLKSRNAVTEKMPSDSDDELMLIE